MILPAIGIIGCMGGFMEYAGSMVETPSGTIFRSDTVVTAEEMLSALSEADVVFVGEKHDDPLAHMWELFIWTRLAGPDRALALEMFETDVQELLDGYLSGTVPQEEFLEGSRPWGNYAMDYSLMVEYARLKGYRVIAANVPRHFASDVARGGWDALSDEEWFREVTVDSSNSGYRERFLETMGIVGGEMHEMPMDPMDMYRAQSLKDAVMARSIEGERCVFVCGSFHSDYRSGIPDQLAGGTTFLTVRVLTDGEEYSPELADFVIVP